MKTQNEVKTKKVKIEDQPLSSYPYIAYNCGFNSLHEVAEHFEIDYDKLVAEVKASKNPQKKIITGAVGKLRHKELFYKGKPISTEEIMEMTGLSKAIIRKRAQRGWTAEKIINTPVQERKIQTFEIGGKIYHGAGELAKAFKMSARTVQARLNAGMTPEEAVFTPVKETDKKQSGHYWIGGNHYETVAEVCQAYGLSESSIYAYSCEHKNECLNDIIAKKITRPVFRYMVNGEGYPSIKAVAIAAGVDANKLYYEMHSGRHKYIEDAIRKLKSPIVKKEKAKKSSKYTVFGKGFNSHREICEYFGISVANYNHHLYKLKESPEEIVTYFQNKEKGVK